LRRKTQDLSQRLGKHYQEAGKRSPP